LHSTSAKILSHGHYPLNLGLRVAFRRIIMGEYCVYVLSWREVCVAGY
jgi:hypothetical protein